MEVQKTILKKRKKSQKKASYKTAEKFKENIFKTYRLSADSALLSVLLFLLPLAYAPVLNDKYELPKLILIFTLLPLVYLLFFIRGKELVIGKIDILFALFAGFSALSAAYGLFFNNFSQAAFFGSLHKPLGALTVVYIFFLVLITSQFSDDWFITRAFVLGGSALGVVAVFQKIVAFKSSTFQGRVFATSGNPVYLGVILLFYLLFILESRLSAREKAVYTLPIAIGLLLSGTRAAFAGLVAAFIVYLIVYIFLPGRRAARDFRDTFKSLTFVLAPLGLFVALWLNRFSSIKDEFAKRAELFKASLNAFYSSPLTGIGLSGFESFYRKMPGYAKFISRYGEVPDSSHSAFLDNLSGSGLLAFLSFAGIFVVLAAAAPAFAAGAAAALFLSPLNLNAFLIFSTSSALISNRTDNKKIISLKIKGWLRILLTILSALSLISGIYSATKMASANYFYEKHFSLIHKGDIESAFQNLDRARNILPSEIQYLLDIASNRLMFYGSGELEGSLSQLNSALKELESAVEKDPYNFSLYLLKGRVLLAIGDMTGSAEYYEKAAEALKIASYLSPYEPEVYYELGIAYGATKDYKNAVKMFEKAVNLKGNSTDYHFALGYAYELSGDYEKAKETYKNALKYSDEMTRQKIEEALKRVYKNLDK